MCVEIIKCRLEKIKKLNVVIAVTCAIVVKNLAFWLSKIKMLKRLSEVFTVIFGGCSHVSFFPL